LSQSLVDKDSLAIKKKDHVGRPSTDGVRTMSLATRVLLGLALGLAGGIAISNSSSELLAGLPTLVEPIGTLWVNAIRMSVIPLLMALLITSIAGEHDSGLVATLGTKAVGFFVLMTAAVCLYTAAMAPPLLVLFELDPGIAESLRATAGSTSSTVDIPGFSDWLSGLIPANAFKAAADGSILQLIVFTVLFAIALGRVEEAKRNALLNFFTAIKEAMYVLIGWIMAAAPFGVFALMLPLATKMGTSAAGAFGYFILIACSLITLAMILLYPLAVWVGRVRLVDFARACAPAQVIGFSTRSSLASLPAMISAAENLRLSPRISGLLLPIAVSVFKFASPIGRSCGAYFIAKLYGIELGPTDILIIAGALGVMSFYSPGIPSGGLLVMTPLFVSLNLPVEGIGILIALDLVVDMFITPTNVAANLTVATLLTRGDRGG